MLSTIVTEEDIINTYKPRARYLANLYLEYSKLRGRGITSASHISNILRCKRYIIKNFIYHKNKPPAIKSVEFLKLNNLLPLKSKPSKKLLLLTKLLGFSFGDGHIRPFNFSINLAGQREDIIKIKEQIEHMFNIKTKMRRTDGVGVAWSLFIYAAPLGRLLCCMGASIGDKLSDPFRIPTWLLKADIELKRVFLDILFANELSSPALNKQNCFRALDMSLWKNENHLQSLFEFMTDIKQILNDNFSVDSVVVGYERSYTRKKDPQIRIKSYVLRIKNSRINLHKFLSQFDFELCCRKNDIKNKLIPILESRLSRRPYLNSQ